MFAVDQLVAHAVGDYVLQSHWMATEKTRRSAAAAAHALCYTLPFLALTRSPVALAVVCSTHFVIDRWRLARYVVWAKNFLAPRRWLPDPYIANGAPPGGEGRRVRHYRWSECSATGYGPDVPPWLAVWLLIIVDNLMHVGCNALAISLWGAA